ncbi:MAG: hypothetical protein RJB65_2278 [Actinomycetota bacterium]|jgi:hypothetical protein
MRLRSRRVLLGTALAMMAAPFATSLSTTVVSAAAGDISNIDHAAPLQNLYDHSTGGGYYNDGSTTYVKNELQGEDFACGDRVTFLAYFETAADPEAAEPFSVRLTQTFTTDTTGQSGVALFPIANSVKINNGDPALVPATPTAFVNGSGTVTASGDAFTSGSTESITYTVRGLRAGQQIVTRVDARIGCLYEATPTGNLQADLTSAVVLDPLNGDEDAGSGAQTINFRNVANLTNLGQPALVVEKTVMADGGTCGIDDAPSINVAIDAPVTYCYVVTNAGTGPALDVTLIDDMATPLDNSDDVVLTLDGLTDEDGDTNADDLGATPATAELAGVSYSTSGEFTNTATASSDGGTYTATATAVVSTEPVDPEIPYISLTKSRVGSESVALGDDITYRLVATNDSIALTLDDVTIVDDNAVITDCDQDMPASLAPGESLVCTAVHTVTQADVDAGEVINVATVDGYEATTDSNLDGVASNAVVVVLAAMPVTGSSDGLVTLALFVFGLGILVAVYSRRETLA